MTPLDEKILQTHATGDTAALATLYAEAAKAQICETSRGFFLTQAYVFALDAGLADASHLRDLLIASGRESSA